MDRRCAASTCRRRPCRTGCRRRGVEFKGHQRSPSTSTAARVRSASAILNTFSRVGRAPANTCRAAAFTPSRSSGSAASTRHGFGATPPRRTAPSRLAARPRRPTPVRTHRTRGHVPCGTRADRRGFGSVTWVISSPRCSTLSCCGLSPGNDGNRQSGCCAYCRHR